MGQKIHYINGFWEEGSGDELRAWDKSTDETLWVGKSASLAQVEKAALSARRAFSEWSQVSLEKRIEIIKNFQKILETNKEKYSLELSRETGKPLWESRTELGSMIAKADISIEAYKEKNLPRSFPVEGGFAYERYKPLGMVAVIGPYNMPGHLPNGHILPALLAGNTVLFKPSELTPQTAVWMVAAWEEAGLPGGVLNLLQGGLDTARGILTRENLKGVFFTGSSATGRSIHAHFAGRPDVLLALEMGGNNPVIVHKIENQTQAVADMVLDSAYTSAGQRCTAARRLILLKDREGDDFLDALTEKIRGVKAGFYFDKEEAYMGTLISPDAAQRVLGQTQKILQSGARELVPLEALRGRQNLLSAALLDSTDVREKIDEEIFGPVLQVIRVSSFADAIREANNTRYGLAAALFSGDPELYRVFWAEIEAGIVNFNRKTTGASSRLPFGGIKESGSHWPGAYSAAHYCSHPVASLEKALSTTNIDI